MFAPSFLVHGQPRLLSEATALEDELGPERAVARIRQQITEADRRGRRRLYRLHDEIVRRYDWKLPIASLTP